MQMALLFALHVPFVAGYNETVKALEQETYWKQNPVRFSRLNKGQIHLVTVLFAESM